MFFIDDPQTRFEKRTRVSSWTVYMKFYSDTIPTSGGFPPVVGQVQPK
jgi:hypothetical protein